MGRIGNHGCWPSAFSIWCRITDLSFLLLPPFPIQSCNFLSCLITSPLLPTYQWRCFNPFQHYHGNWKCEHTSSHNNLKIMISYIHPSYSAQSCHQLLPRPQLVCCISTIVVYEWGLNKSAKKITGVHIVS